MAEYDAFIAWLQSARGAKPVERSTKTEEEMRGIARELRAKLRTAGMWKTFPFLPKAARSVRTPAGHLVAVTRLLALCVVLSAPPNLGAVDRESPLERAIDFLVTHQVRQPLDVVVNGARVVDFPGDWPQYFNLQGGEAFRVRDVSPFTVAFIHHALTHVVEENRRALGLSPLDLEVARVMRQRAVTFLRRFESAPDAPDAGTFAFWPYDADPATPDALLTFLLTAWLQGPILGGQRVPINLSIYPSTLAIPSDADVTATTYATLLDDAIFDGGPGSEVAFERFFVDWRDLGVVPRRLNPSWLPPAERRFPHLAHVPGSAVSAVPQRCGSRGQCQRALRAGSLRSARRARCRRSRRIHQFRYGPGSPP